MVDHYLISALRNFWRHRSVFLINILGLSIGLTCFIAAWSGSEYLERSDEHLVREPGVYAVSERLSSATEDFDTGEQLNTSPLLARYLQADLPSVEAIARVEPLDDDIAIVAGMNAVSARAAAADGALLDLFAFPFIAGDARTALDEPRSAVVSSRIARQLFGTHEIHGKHLVIQNVLDVTVTGVMDEIPQPSQFGHTASSVVQFDVLLSWDVSADLQRQLSGRASEDRPEVDQWGMLGPLTYLRLAEGGPSAASVDEQLRGFARRYVSAERTAIVDYQFALVPVSAVWTTTLDAKVLRGSSLSVTTVLKLLGCIVLLTACINYANLATAQAITRTREVGLRKVLGANRARILLQFLIESSVVAAIALGVALLVLAATVPILAAHTGIAVGALLGDPLSLIGFFLVLTIVVAIVAGAYPAFVLAGIRPIQSLRTVAVRTGHALVPGLLVGLQFAAASLLLIAVIVVFTQNRQLRIAGLDAAEDPVIAIGNDLKTAKVDGETLRTLLLQHPAIHSAAITGDLPWIMRPSALAITRSLDAGSEVISPLLRTVSRDVFTTLNIGVLAGRVFDESRGDDRVPQGFPRAGLDAERSFGIVIDRELAAQLGWADPKQAVDQLVYLPLARVGMANQPVRIIGVVENQPLLLTAAAGVKSTMYVLAGFAGGFPLIRIDRTRIAEALSVIDSQWHQLAPNVPLKRRFVDDLFEQGYSTYGRINQIIAGLAILAFAIAAMGLFGMATFIVNRRRREIGIRKSLGASAQRIGVMLLGDFSRPVVVANLAAWPLGYLAAQAYLSAFVQKIPLSLLPFILSLAITLLLAWLVIARQAVEAARTRPASVLRYE